MSSGSWSGGINFWEATCAGEHKKDSSLQIQKLHGFNRMQRVHNMPTPHAPLVSDPDAQSLQ